VVSAIAIPGHCAANPESIVIDYGLWIPGQAGGDPGTTGDVKKAPVQAR
jgi:hypothetical protein